MNPRLLVCDLDNTLYDWVGYFVPSFYAMVDSVVTITGCNKTKLLDDFRLVHQRVHDSEQPFSLLQTETIRKLYSGASEDDILKVLDPAFHAFNSARKRSLHLYPGVIETLEILTKSGVILVAHTESKLFGVVDRMRRLNITQYFRKIYCRESIERASASGGRGVDWFAEFPIDRVIELSHHQAKPNPEVLLEICSDEGVRAEEAAYVGDSVARDMLMAKRAGVLAIWAAYGASHDPAMYDALVRVSHWTSEEVAREKLLREEARKISPDYTARNSFAEVLRALGIADGLSELVIDGTSAS